MALTGFGPDDVFGVDLDAANQLQVFPVVEGQGTGSTDSKERAAKDAYPPPTHRAVPKERRAVRRSGPARGKERGKALGRDDAGKLCSSSPSALKSGFSDDFSLKFLKTCGRAHRQARRGWWNQGHATAHAKRAAP